jgi:SOS-response transcriptional repressor LexA
MLGGKSLGRLVDAVEVLAEWGFAHDASDCTRVGYDTQATLYPRWVLDRCRGWEQPYGMAIPLKQARRAAKLSQEALGKAAHSGRSTIVKLEDGTLPMTEAWAKRLAPHLGLRPDQLYAGPEVPVIGYVGAGARVYAYDDLLNENEKIARPPMTTGDLFAVEVKGDSMLPLAEEGWHIVYTAEATVDENLVIGKVCVVQLDEDESMLVKRVIRGSMPHHYHLVSLNAPAIENVRLRWAAVVKAIVPR